MRARILIIEDQPNWQQIFKNALPISGYQLEITADMESAKNLLNQNVFQLALVNMNLIDDPQIPLDYTGEVLLEFIKQKHPNLPRIVITGSPEGPIFEKFAPFGVNDVLIKSHFRMPDLMRAINNALNNQKNQDGSQIKEKSELETSFDIFLAHNSKDKPQVEQIAAKLKQRQLTYWLDTEQIAPGKSFQDEIQEAIPQVKSAAIFIGTNGLGKWQVLELRSLISQCVEKEIPVIPVLLPGVENIPVKLVFLKELNWVQFQHIDDKDALDNLEWGITGERPQ